MKEEEDQINPDENDLQQNYQNTFNSYSVPQYNVPQVNTVPQNNIPQVNDVPQNNIPQVNIVPQYNIPQVNTVPQYSVPQDNNAMQNYQPQVIPNNQINNQVYLPMPIAQNQLVEYQNINQNEQKIQNIQQNQKGNVPEPYEIISFISWFFFMGSKWDMYRKMSSIQGDEYQPILYNRSFIELITLIISAIGFLIYVQNIIYKRNKNLYYSLFGQNTKYHFVPLILYSCINIVFDSGIISPDEVDSEEKAADWKAISAFYMIFSLLSLLSLIYIYISFEMNCEWYIVMSIKKGIYSILIVECLYHFLDSIFFVRLINIVNSNSKIKDLYRIGGIIFAILQGGLIFGFSFYYKNIIMPILNFLMFYGMIMNYYTKSIEVIDWKSGGVIGVEIFMLAANFLEIVYLIAKHKEQLIE